jgi:uncharacterized protein (UPF0332 family)
MNAEILKERINAELERAKEASTAAKNLFEDGLYSDSVSRAYYAVLHSARAVLLTKDIDPQSHSGAISMFGQHFVKPGIIDKKFGRVFDEMRDVRELGDYIATKKFSKEETSKRLEQATEFLNEMLRQLKPFIS